MTDPTPSTPGAAEWDERYGAALRVWSGDPNGTLVTEVGDLSPGRALDVGCGEGADAVWLARRGWQVTALDVSQVALDRAERHARDAGVTVRWLHVGLVEAELPRGGFDLVSAQYPVLLRTPDALAERTLAGLVAPGGTLLVVHHALDGAPGEHHGHDVHTATGRQAGDHPAGGCPADPSGARGFDPTRFVLPADVAAVLGDGWQVEVHERRARAVRGGGGAHHVEDLVLRARRR